MSPEYSSSNPFRRKGAPSDNTSVSPDPLPRADNSLSQQQQTESRASQSAEVTKTKKPAKKVRVQSPHPTSPHIPHTPSTVVGGGDSIYYHAPTLAERDNDPFERDMSEASLDEGGFKPSQAPSNPFKKTLETIEQPKREAITTRTNVTNKGRASLDVEAFKRLLMTGNADPGMSTLPSAPPAILHHGLGDGGSSSTDASSLSRHSIFEPVHEHHLGLPSSPNEIAEPEDDRRGAEIISPANGRKKPPPPSSRHGKLIKLELRGDSSSTPTLPISTPTIPTAISPIPISSPQSSSRSSTIHSQSPSSSPSVISSPTYLNKPLPLAPDRSHYSDRQSVFDLESAGKVPEPPSPSQSIRRRTPPPPPLTRRRSQRVPDYRTPREDMERLSTSVEEEALSQEILGISNIDPTGNGGVPRFDSGRVPPPPPSRRPASIRGSINQNFSSSLSSQPLSTPALLPERGSSFRERPQDVVIDASTNKRASMIPPLPPPPRKGDSHKRMSEEYSRKSWDSTRKGSETSSVQEERHEERPDILADLTKLQREIDALRSGAERSLS